MFCLVDMNEETGFASLTDECTMIMRDMSVVKSVGIVDIFLHVIIFWSSNYVFKNTPPNQTTNKNPTGLYSQQQSVTSVI